MCVNGFSAKENNANGLSRMHLAKPFTQLYRFKLASDYPVIGGFSKLTTDEALVAKHLALFRVFSRSFSRLLRLSFFTLCCCPQIKSTVGSQNFRVLHFRFSKR